MELGVVFPQTEIGSDPTVVRDYAQAAEQLGYHHLATYDHVLGGHPDRFQGAFRPPYTHETSFHEPFVLFGYLAGLTTRLGLVTGILILPQRQTALVAKQAAEVDLLSGGRLRLALASRDRVPDVARFLVGAGVAVHALEPRRPSLEEVFLDLMGSDHRPG